MTAVVITLRLIHIVLGAAWFGIVVFTTVFLAPAIQEVGPAGGPVMGALQRRGMVKYLPLIAAGTLLSGLALYWIMSDGFNPVYVHSRVGGTFALGGALAIGAFVYGMTVMRPSMMRAMTLAQTAGATPTDEQKAELARLRARGASASRIVLVLLTLSTAAMAIARYT